MTVRLRRENSAVHFVAENDAGNTVDIDGDEAVGGENAGFRPMQLLLASLAGCASMDLVPILKKQRQRLDDVSVRVDGTRAEGVVPRPFTAIHLHFDLYGEVDVDKAARAVELSVEKYCSVAESLSPEIALTHSYEVHAAG